MTAYYACPDCGYQFTIEQGQEVPDQRTVCPECGGEARETGAGAGAAQAQAAAHDATVVKTENDKGTASSP